MAFSYIQSTASGAVGEDTTSYETNLTAGSLLITAVYWNHATATCDTSDSLNGAWTPLGSPQTGADSLAAWRLQFFYFLNSAAGAAGVTSTISEAVTMAHAIHEHSSSFGGAAVQLDGGATYSSPINQAGSTTTGAVVTTADSDLLFAGCVAEVSVSAAGAGFVIRELAAFNGNGTEDDLDGGSAGSKTAGFTLSGTNDVILGLVAFRDQAPAGGGPTIQLRPTVSPLRW